MFEGFLLKEVPNDTWTLVIENHSIRNSCPCFMNDLHNMIQSHRFSIAGLFFFRGDFFFWYGPRWAFQSPPGRDLSLRYRNGSQPTALCVSPHKTRLAKKACLNLAWGRCCSLAIYRKCPLVINLFLNQSNYSHINPLKTQQLT